ncbi:hypothetical protein ADUPG1_013153, partial [Aduncisulcus paluster]
NVVDLTSYHSLPDGVAELINVGVRFARLRKLFFSFTVFTDEFLRGDAVLALKRAGIDEIHTAQGMLYLTLASCEARFWEIVQSSDNA